MTKTVSGTTTIEAQYGYDPYGIATKLQGSQDADFQYAGYYLHARSGLNLPVYRAYSSSLGRFINRDPIGEDGGANLFLYTENNPISFFDHLGLITDDDLMMVSPEDDYDRLVEDTAGYIAELTTNILSKALARYGSQVLNKLGGAGGDGTAVMNAATNRGKLGSPITRKQVCDLGKEFVKVTHGGGQKSEERISKRKGGQQGSVYPDITAQDPSGLKIRVQTIDTLKSGLQTRRERRNALKIMRRTAGSGSILISVPKP